MSKTMIDSKDISVVIQGAVDNKIITKTIKSIKKYMPNSEIILSTWNGTDVSNLKVDSVVFNQDPKGYEFEKGGRLNNLNRIIISSQSGINKVDRKYTLLMRSDMVLINNNILRFKDTYKRNNNVALFKKRIFTYEMYSIQYEMLSNMKYYSIFHISDWCRFGLTEDIKELFNIQTVKEPEFSRYFEYNYHDKYKDIWPERMWKMSPEQYITSENAKKIYKNLNVQDRLDWSDNILNCSDEFIVNNFIIKGIKEWGIINLKPQYKGANIKNGDMTKNGAWLGKNWFWAYFKYCDKEYKLPLKYRWQDNLGIREYVVHLNKHYNKFKLPIKRFFRWLSEPIPIISYSIKILGSSLLRIHRLFK